MNSNIILEFLYKRCRIFLYLTYYDRPDHSFRKGSLYRQTYLMKVIDPSHSLLVVMTTITSQWKVKFVIQRLITTSKSARSIVRLNSHQRAERNMSIEESSGNCINFNSSPRPQTRSQSISMKVCQFWVIYSLSLIINTKERKVK